MTMHLSSQSTSLPQVYSWFSALISEDIPTLESLLAHGLPVDVPHPLRHTTALMEATRLGRPALVRFLLDHGAAPAFLCGAPVGSPLHCAVRRRQWKITGMLLDRTNNVAVLDGYGRTPLHVMAMDEHDNPSLARALPVAAQLLDKGCPIDALDDEGITVLHYAIINDLDTLVALLLERGANANVLTPDTQVSPITIAALEKNLTLASMLLQYGANPHMPTRDGSSAATILPAIAHLAEDLRMNRGILSGSSLTREQTRRLN